MFDVIQQVIQTYIHRRRNRKYASKMMHYWRNKRDDFDLRMRNLVDYYERDLGGRKPNTKSHAWELFVYYNNMKEFAQSKAEEYEQLYNESFK